MNIIPRYIIKEILPNFLVGLAFFEIIMLVQQVFKLVDMHVKDNVPLIDVANLFIYTLPFTMQLTIPIGVLVGCLLAVGRLSGESEIIAMRASGMSLLRIFIPTFAFGLTVTLMHLGFVEYVVPWGNTNYVTKYREIIQVNPTIVLTKESSLSAHEYYIQVDAVDSKTNELFKIRIRDKVNNRLILAETGKFLKKDEQKNAFPLLLHKVTQQPYIQWRHKDRENFEEKYNEKQIIYIPDTKRKVQDDPYNIKSQSISRLNEMINERSSKKIARVIGHVNNYAHNFQKLQIMREMRKEQYSDKDPSKKISMNQNENSNIKSAEYPEGTANDRIPPGLLKNEDYNRVKFREVGFPTSVREYNITGHAGGRLGENKKERAQSFDNRLRGLISQIRQRAKEIERSFEKNMDELLKTYLFEFHIKVAIPFACFAFTLVGAPLGIFSGRSGKSMSLGFCLIIGVSWFGLRIIMSLGYKDGWLGPMEAAWIPNVILFTAGFILSINRIRG